MLQSVQMPSPVGMLTLVAEREHVVALQWAAPPQADGHGSDVLNEAKAQLAAYFEGRLTAFDLPLRIKGSAFLQAVCAQMSAIPLGVTRTYGEIAQALGKAAQPVGNACGTNPLPIIIPCHRVLGANGLGGFSGAGGVETKVALLRHEGAAGLLI